jgi:hypothetical protein
MFPLPFAAMVRVAFVEGIKLRTPNKMDSHQLILKRVANCSELHKPCVVNNPMELLPVVVDPVFLGFWCRGRFFLAASSSSNLAYPSFQVKGLIAKERER